MLAKNKTYEPTLAQTKDILAETLDTDTTSLAKFDSNCFTAFGNCVFNSLVSMNAINKPSNNVRVNSNRKNPPGQTQGICLTMSPGGREFDS